VITKLYALHTGTGGETTTVVGTTTWVVSVYMDGIVVVASVVWIVAGTVCVCTTVTITLFVRVAETVEVGV